MLLLSPILIKIQTKQKCKTFLEMIFMTDMKLRKLVLAALFAALRSEEHTSELQSR